MGRLMVRYSIVAALMLTAVPAMAQQRPRDAVMAGAYRCSATGAPRQWLDCYYGAAQPARNQLGLPPAPQSQIALSLSPPASDVNPRIAAIRDAVMAAALRCYATENERAWLECYYAAAAPMRSELGLSTPAQAAAMPGPLLPSTQAGATPDRSILKALAPGRVDHVVTRMASYTFDRNHIFTATLTNGQIWRQVSGDTNNAHWTKPASDYSVKITRGFLSSYNFQVEGFPEVYKVDPVR
jgi:hypothetical protein